MKKLDVYRKEKILTGKVLKNDMIGCQKLKKKCSVERLKAKLRDSLRGIS